MFFGTMNNRSLSAALSLSVSFLCIATASPAGAQQCTPKTAGYFTQMPAFGRTAPSPVQLAGIPQSLTGAIGSPARGRQVVADEGKGNCLACHPVPALSELADHGDLGPNLAGVGARFTEAQLRQILVDPNVLFQDTIMPAYHKPPAFDRVPADLAGKTVLSADEVEDIVAFLKNLK
jgi:sulfur-oxidizing protein SoxX